MITELTRRLQDQGVDSDIRLVDGAAMIFYGSRRMTQDIDASYSHTEEVEAVARQMAAEHNLPENWLNDSAPSIHPRRGSMDRCSEWARDGPRGDR